jgi:predicted  nucleic acid-binding Zn-ribbon protein
LERDRPGASFSGRARFFAAVGAEETLVKPEEIQALLALQELDLKLLEFERHQAALPRFIEKIEAPLKVAQAAKERVETELEVARNQHRHFETELVTNNERFKKIQTQQMGVRNQVEYEAFQHEMESLKERADSLEESGLKWIERVEDAKTRLPEVTEQLEEQEKIAAGKRSELDAKTAELKRIHDEASELCAPHIDKIPPNVFSYYKRLRGAGKKPFAAVVKRGACSGCGFRHPPQMLQEIRQSRKMKVCEQCGRIQVWVEQEQEQVGF